MVCLVVAPVFLGLALTSREIVDLVLGPAWPLARPPWWPSAFVRCATLFASLLSRR